MVACRDVKVLEGFSQPDAYSFAIDLCSVEDNTESKNQSPAEENILIYFLVLNIYAVRSYIGSERLS